jgi:hypothetical protein
MSDGTQSGRGVLYVVWGDAVDGLLDRSLASVRRFHPELSVHVERLEGESSLLDKSRMHELTPFDETLYLDADTVVLDRLDSAFEHARRVGLACSICECPWARRYGGLAGDLVEYNTGVLFFTSRAHAVFERWKACAHEVDSSIDFIRNGRLQQMPYNDQAGFAKAVDEVGIEPIVLPFNWNFRPEWHKSFWGPIKVWHDYRPVPDQLLQWNDNQIRESNPVQYTEIR